jgi:hypothetical protein
MKTSAEKTSTTASATPQAVNHPFFRKAGEDGFFAPAVQLKMTVNKTGDPFEQEADRMADKVMRAPAPAEEKIQKAEAPERLQRKEDGGAPAVDAGAESAIGAKTTGGQPLSDDVRGFMEPRFGADFSGVRVHSDAESAGLSNQLSARAFTYQNHVFFSNNQYQPGTSEGKQLLAHELTHTIQQGHAVQRSPQLSVTASTPPIQRLGMQDALDYFADKANFIPGFRLLCILLGFNPINRRNTERSAANILRALIELLPGGALITQALDNHGVINKAGAWIEQQLATLGDIGSDIMAGLRRFIDSLSWTDIFDLGGVWDRAKAIFTNPIGRLIAFGGSVVVGLMRLVKEAVLRPLAKMAEGTAGYDLLKAVLGQDPITGDPVPRTADTLIGGFMKLIGQEEVWQNIKKGNAIGRAWDWFQGALGGLMGFVRSIPGQIVAAVSSITWQDVITIVGIFAKVGRAFVNIVGQFFSWAGAQVISLLEIIFSVVAPGAVPYIKKAQGAFRSIIQNPIGFVGNLVRAGKQGFQMFANNIGEHLKAALIKWITGPLGEAGVYIPQSFSLMEIVKLVLSVLGLTWQNIRGKLVKIIPEPVLQLLEKTAGILVTLVKDGPAAAWEQIKAELSELKDMMIAKVTEMITTEVVKAAVTKLVSMLNPAGAVIQAIIAIYNTVTFFIQKINQIAAVVGSFIDSVAAIAAGQVDSAAKKVEMTMANTLTVIIAFLAKFAGLGNVPEKLVGIIKKIRQPIDRGLDKIVAWLGNLLQKIGAAAKAGVKRLLNWWKKKLPVSVGGEQHNLMFEGEGKQAKLVLRSTPEKPSVFLGSTAEKKKVAVTDRKAPVDTCVSKEDGVEAVLIKLRAVDENKAPAATGTSADQADKDAADLDVKLIDLAAHLGATLQKWLVSDGVIDKINLPRGSFSLEQKRGIAKQHKNQDDLKLNSKGELINVSRTPDNELARRHVVSSNDMSVHYAKSLNGKKISEGKLLLEQRGSISQSHTAVADFTNDGIQKAATERYSNFFGYLRNLFIGNSRENSSIQEHLDAGHPDLAGNLLEDHVRHVKRAWALDDSIEISRLDKP